MAGEATKTCPSCAGEIPAASVSCERCGASLQGGPRMEMDPIGPPPVASAAPRPAIDPRLAGGIVCFGLIVIWSGVRAWLGVGLAQAGVVGYLTPLWNAVITAVLLYILSGLIRQREWALQWGIGTCLLNALGDLVNAGSAQQAWLLLPVAAGVAGALLLHAGRSGFRSGQGLKPRRVTSLEKGLTLCFIAGAVTVSAIDKDQKHTPGKAFGETIVRERVHAALKAPATAKFTSVRILEQKGRKYLGHVVVQTQGEGGAPALVTLCVAVEAGQDGAHYYYGPQEGLLDCPGQGPWPLDEFKRQNHWDEPGYYEARAPRSR